MPTHSDVATVLVKEDTLFPPGMMIQTEVFLPGWRAVKNFDAFLLGKKIREADWNFFYLTGETSALASGREGPETLRKAVKKALGKRDTQTYNSLEIVEVTPKSFLGIPFVRVTLRSRHVQQSPYLLPLLPRGPIHSSEGSTAIALPVEEPKPLAEQHTVQI